MIYILIMNAIGFCLMGLDKHRARTRQWRVPEKILFGAALLGGSAGVWAGMYAVSYTHLFDIFSGGVQALVFSLLTMVYVGNACPPPEEA